MSQSNRYYLNDEDGKKNFHRIMAGATMQQRGYSSTITREDDFDEIYTGKAYGGSGNQIAYGLKPK